MIYKGGSPGMDFLCYRGGVRGWGMCGETEMPRGMEICVAEQRCLEA